MNYTHNTRDVETAVKKIEYLYSIVTGDAEKPYKKVCSHSNPDDALTKLWKTYKSRYGTAKSSVDLLLRYVSQKAVVELSASGLRTLLDDLTACETEAIMTKPEALDNHHFLDTFAMRLPSNLQACLYTKIAELTSTQSHDYEQLAEFVRGRLMMLEVHLSFCSEKIVTPTTTPPM